MNRATRSGHEITASRIVDELTDLATSTDFVGALHRSAALAAAAASTRGDLADQIGELAALGPYPALLALDVLAAMPDATADQIVADLVAHPDLLVRRHATWRAGDRRPVHRALPHLADQLLVGGIDTMHAHRTLRRWAAADPLPVGRHVIHRLAATDDATGRARLVDLVGVLPGSDTDELLTAIAADRDEPSSARIAAIGALGERPSTRVDGLLSRLAADDDEIGAHAALALRDPGAAADGRGDGDPGGGLRMAQLVMVEGLDGQLSRGGRGDTGGVASLLVSLGEALARRDDVERVLTIGRGSVTDALTAPMPVADALRYGVLAVGDGDRPASSPDATWEHLPAIERGIRRVLRLAGPVDLLHLRMADVGTLAGAEVARQLGIGVCFSVAPDPHNVVQSLQSRGELDTASFLRLDADGHVWFRARLVEALARDADRLALFPRARSFAFLDDLARTDGFDHRAAVVAEGIDTALLRRVAADDGVASTTRRFRGDVLGELAERIPAHRRGLPLVLSVGRLHPVKGMERLVAAWAADPTLSATCNLVVVGGDLEQPSPVERAVLDDIDRAAPPDRPVRDGLVLLGGRPHSDVAALLVGAARGRTGAWPAGGVYVDGALKEEFGLAILEAMAAGLVVVAPSTGGPSTYVDDGDTGVLVDPDADLAAAIHTAFSLVDRPGRVDRARALVEERYSVDTMAGQLADLYRPTAVVL